MGKQDGVKIKPKPLAAWETEILENRKNGYLYITIPKSLDKTNVIQKGQPIFVAVWQEGRV